MVEDLIKKAEGLYFSASDGAVSEADAVLADLVLKQDYESGVLKDLFGIYRKSNDKQTVCRMFYLFTGVELDDFLKGCMAKTAAKNRGSKELQGCL